MHSIRDVQEFMTFKNKTSVVTQTEVPKPERWQTVKFLWRNKKTILACLCLLAAMGWQLKEQAQEIENLKAASAHVKAVHKQQLDEARSEEVDKANAALEETRRLHSLELENCKLLREREKEQEMEEVRERRQKVMDHRTKHRHGEVDEADAMAEKEALRKEEEQRLLEQHRKQQETVFCPR